jgi:hypothetical protein
MKQYFVLIIESDGTNSNELLEVLGNHFDNHYDGNYGYINVKDITEP